MIRPSLLAAPLLSALALSPLAACSSVPPTEPPPREAKASEAISIGPPPAPVGNGPIPLSSWSSAWDALGGSVATATDPAFVATGSQLYAFVATPSGALQWNTAATGGAWSGWQSLPDAISGSPVAITANGLIAVFYVHPPDYHVHFFAYGLYGVNQWLGPTDIGGQGASHLAAVTVNLVYPQGIYWNGVWSPLVFPEMDVFAYFNSDGLLHETYAEWEPTSIGWNWSPWSTIGTPTVGVTSYSVVSPDGVSASVVAAAGGLGVMTRPTLTGSWPSSWTMVPTSAGNDVIGVSSAALSNGDVAAVWQDQNGALRTKDWAASGAWGGESLLGDTFFHGRWTPQVALAAQGTQLQMLAVQQDYTLASASVSEGAGAASWTSLGSGCEGHLDRPALVATTATRLDALVVGQDRGVYHTYYDVTVGGSGAQPPSCSCGGVGQQCCGTWANGTGCNTADAQCAGPGNNTCEACGGLGEACCAVRGCDHGMVCGTVNGAAECVLCGGVGQPCCGPYGTCNGSATCVGTANATCQLVGQEGEPCAPGGTCASPDSCVNGHCYDPGKCGATGQMCCSGSCSGGAPCNGGVCGAAPLTCKADSYTACDISAPNGNYLITEAACDSLCGSGCNSTLDTIVEYVNLPVGADLTICSWQAVPSGWFALGQPYYSAQCGYQDGNTVLIQRGTPLTSCASATPHKLVPSGGPAGGTGGPTVGLAQ